LGVFEWTWFGVSICESGTDCDICRSSGQHLM
jgi:hypothetical protein